MLALTLCGVALRIYLQLIGWILSIFCLMLLPMGPTLAEKTCTVVSGPHTLLVKLKEIIEEIILVSQTACVYFSD